VRAYVINLARSRDRRAHITAELKKTGLDYEVITGVDGRELNMQDENLVDPEFAVNGIFPEGSAGCALSHLEVYKKVIADDLDVALVLEDDVNLPADLEGLADIVAAQLTGAEVALLSIDSPEPCRISRDKSVPLPQGRMLALPISAAQPRSAGAYVITREACERLVKFLLPIRIQADSWWYFYREGAIDRVRCVAPIAVLKNAQLTSTIGHYSLGNGFRNRLIEPLVSSKIPVLHQVLSYRRQRIFRQWGRLEIVTTPFEEMPSRLD
jgi:glycosyl transferase, family 25